jgi:hypothetical protein
MEDNFFKEGHNYHETYLGLLRGFKRILDKYPIEPISSILNGFDGTKYLLNTYAKTVIENNLIDGCVFLLTCDETNNPPTVINTNNFRVYVDVKHPYKTLVKEFHFTLPEDFDKLLENTDVVRDGEKHTPYFDIIDEDGQVICSNPECKDKYEMVNHPSHYNNYSVEVIAMMKGIWGAEKTALWCEMTAFKYRMRMGTKPENPIMQDLEKEKWYLNEAKKLRLAYEQEIKKVNENRQN